MGNEPTLLFCVGATKAGTSWFHRYLVGHPECHMRGVKELHYFDAFDAPESSWQVRQIRRDQKALQSRLQASDSAAETLQTRIDDYQDLLDLHGLGARDDGAYLNYLTKGRQGERLIADVTPAYGLLSADRFRQMANLLPRVRFLYLIRDPVSRLWSHIRMLAARRVASAERLQKAAQRIFWRFGRGRFPVIWDRSDYRKTLMRLDQALAPGQLLTVFYENLFSQAAIRRICQFLGIQGVKAKVHNRVHAGPDVPMDSNMVAHAQEWLAPQYEFIRNRFASIPQEWQANMVGAKA